MRLRKLIIIVITLLSEPELSNSQNYLILGSEWEQKIERNNDLAPLFYGITKDAKQKKEDETFVKQEIKLTGDTNLAFDKHFKEGRNYFNVGLVDSAILEFNKCYLINDQDIRLVWSVGDLLSYVNGPFKNGDPNLRLIDIFNLNKRLNNSWDNMIVFGDGVFVLLLKNLHNSNKLSGSLQSIKKSLSTPYIVDSTGNILVGLRLDNGNEGFYRWGLQNGKWVSYYPNTTLINVEYTMENGVRNGRTTSFHKNGIKSVEFNFNNGTIEGEHKYYDENGELVKVEFWENDSMDGSKTIRYKNTRVEGDIFQEKDKDGVMKLYKIVNDEKREMK